MAHQMSSVTRDRIEYCLQLIFDDKGGVRITRKQGQLDANERAMSLTVTLPTSIFKRPAITATIEIADEAYALEPIDISVARTALRDAFGCDINLTVNTEEPS